LPLYYIGKVETWADNLFQLRSTPALRQIGREPVQFSAKIAVR
jgi:hypothetical protein